MICMKNFKIQISIFKEKRHLSFDIYHLTFQNGFTLIELIITMAIIAVLAGLSLFALKGARESARDTRRKSDLESIRSAIELFKADCNVYPSSLPAVGTSLTGAAALGCNPANTNIYIQSVPGDPGSNALYNYTRTTTVTYTLCSHLEDSTAVVTGCGTCNPSPCRYKVNNP